MTVNLFQKLPSIWKRLDITVTDVIEDRGFLERFLIAPDAKFNSIEDFILELLRSQNVEVIREEFLSLLQGITGHRWRNKKSREWNRNRLQSSITKSSYKGRWLSIEDLARECGSKYCKILDMASLVGVYDRQASMPQSSHYFDSDFFHPGVFQIWLSDDTDFETFLEEFEYLKPVGTKWLLRTTVSECSTIIELIDNAVPILMLGATYDYTYKIFNEQFGFYNHIPQIAWEPDILSTVWSQLSDSFPNVYGQTMYNYTSQYPVDIIEYTTIWSDINSGNYNIYGESFYDFSLQLPVEPIILT